MGTNKYENGKIYLITDIAYTKFYYGSTCESLSKRLWRHKHVYKEYLQGKTAYKNSICLLFDEFGCENCKIELVELFPTNSKIELRQREGYYQKNNPCINKVIAGRTMKDYYYDNKEHCQAMNKQWHMNNQEKTRQRKKEHREKNKDKLSSIIECKCGSSFTYENKSHHFRTKKHQNWSKQQEPEEETEPVEQLN